MIDAGQKLLDSLAETWDFFFCDVLSMLQAIFHPVQVHKRLKNRLFGFSAFLYLTVAVFRVLDVCRVRSPPSDSCLCFTSGTP